MGFEKTIEFTDHPALHSDDFVAWIPVGLSSAESLLLALFDALRLPGYFGFNWNALSDCLRDLHWIDQRRIVLNHSDVPSIPADELRTYLEVLSESVESWRDDGEHSVGVVFPASARELITRLLDGEDAEGPGEE